MIFKRIILENVRSYESLDLNFQLGSTLLSGDIGSGKTTVLLAIEFALFGLQPGQKGTALLRNGKDSGKVSLELEIDGKEIKIERELKRSKSVSQGKVSIIIDNERKEISIKELKNEIIRLLNYPSEFEKKTNLLYKFTVYTPQEEMKQIMIESADTRINTLRHIFGMDRYKKIKENTELVIKKLKEDIKEKQGFILDLGSKIQQRQEKSDSLQKIKTELSIILQNITTIKQQKAQIEKKIEETDKKIQEKNLLENEIGKSKILFSSKKENVLRLEREIQNLREKKIIFNQSEIENKRKEQIEEQVELKSKQEKNNEILGNINYLNNKKKEAIELRERMSGMEKCPTCLQNVEPEYKINISNKITKELREIEEKLKTNQENKITINKHLEEGNNKLEQIRKEIQELEILRIKSENYQKNQELKQQKEQDKKKLEEDIKILEDQINRLNKTTLDLHRIDEEYNKIKQQLNLIIEKERNSEIKKAEFSREIQIIESYLLELEKEITIKQQAKQKLDKIDELRDWLSEKFLGLILFVEKNVMLKLREEFSRIFNNWFLMLVEDEIEVSLDEQFTPIIEQRGFQTDYSFLSGGERTAIALAYRLALNQVINSLLSKIKTHNLVILDEPTDGFSEQQLDKMRDIFEELDVQQLILVSHEAKIESFVDHVIKVKKEHGISRIE